MKKQTLLSLLLTMLVSMASIEAYSYDIAVANKDGVTIYYNYINDGSELEITQSPQDEKYSGTVNIPETVQMANKVCIVTKIGEQAFYDCRNLTFVSIPNKVSTIEENAFTSCNSLTSITIPSSVVKIGQSAFSGCSGLEKVIVNDLAAWCQIAFGDSEANPLNTAHHLYSDGDTEIKDLIIPNNVTSIGDWAFRECRGLESVTIPSSVTRIGKLAFDYCVGISSVTLSNGLTYIGDAAFRFCNGITTITIPNSVTWIGKTAFGWCTALPSINLPSSLKTINENAFCNCISLTSLIIPDSVELIRTGAFQGCIGLTSLLIPSSVKSIENDAFWNCDGLTSVIIPENVTWIGDRAFNCNNLLSVTSLITEPFNIKNTVFRTNTLNNGTLIVPYGSREKYKATEGWNSFVSIMEHKGTCETPTISYNNGKLIFNCATEGATCISSISDTDVATYNTNEVQLNVTYNINVYATKEGYNNSETATATLCWIDQEPKAEGDINEVAEVKAYPLLIQSRDNKIVISGADDGTDIRVYNVSGSLIGFAQSQGRQAVVDANLPIGSVAIVKVGNNVVKVLLR